MWFKAVHRERQEACVGGTMAHQELHEQPNLTFNVGRAMERVACCYLSLTSSH